MNKVKVIIHCSASAFGNAAEITRWHLQRKFNTIGYHFVVLNGWTGAKKYHSEFDGRIETGRPLDDDKDLEPDEIGAHTLGQNKAVGICLIGNSGSFTLAQIDSLQRLLLMLKRQFYEIEVSQHSDYEPAKPYCAGLSIEQIRYFNKLVT